MPQDKDHYLQSQLQTDHPSFWVPCSTTITVPTNSDSAEKKDERVIVNLLDMEA